MTIGTLYFNSMAKRLLIILIAILSILLIAFFGWYFIVREPEFSVGEAVRNSLPFGSGEDINIPALPTDGELGDMPGAELPLDEFGSPTNSLFRISPTPVAGFVTFKRGVDSMVRYVDRATGHIYDFLLPSGTGAALFVEKIKVTNNTLPKIYEAYFRPDGNAVILRSLEDELDIVKNISLTLTPPQGTSTDALYTVSSTALRGDINAVTVGLSAQAGSGNALFYTLRDTSSIVSAAFNGTGAKTILSSPFSNWNLSAALNRLVVYTKASADVPGYAYTLSTSGGTLAKILGPLNGLMAIPNNLGNRVVYSYTDNNKTRAFAKNLTNNTLTEILPATLAEKCTWSIKQVGMLFCAAPIDSLGPEEPDNWYRGVTHFSDRIWRFDTNNDVAQVLVEPKQNLGTDIDVVEPKLSPDEDYLIFINKTDLSLWALKLD